MYFKTIFPDLNIDELSGKYKLDETDNGYCLSLPLPGLSKEDVELSINNKYLSIEIKGDFDWVKFKEKRFLINTDFKLSTANMKNGVLYVFFENDKKTKKIIEIS